ncbi:AzlC family ABC transporter permease [Goodfellowiella coeruleoviolacea]|nr:AzlC family ABC transporter permease [Goodfellowiella coeruleoviolacea]
MRSLWRTLDRGLLRDVAPIALASGLVGASFGAIAVADGNPLWVPVAMSLLVFAGGAQFMAVGVVAAGGTAVAAVLAALLLNVRHLPFGLAVGHALGGSWPARLVGSHVMTDESVAFAMAQTDPRRARAAFWTCGLALYVCWNIGVVLGALAGSAVGDTDALGIDAAFPAALLALTLPALRDAVTRRCALVGALIAVVATPLVPAGVPVLLSLAGVAAMLLPVPRRVSAPADRPADGSSTTEARS